MHKYIRKRQLNIIWGKGKLNIVDYFTKHHPLCHHNKIRYKYILNIKNAAIVLRAKTVCEGLLHPAMSHDVRIPGSTFHPSFITVIYQYITDPVQHTPNSCYYQILTHNNNITKKIIV